MTLAVNTTTEDQRNAFRATHPATADRDIEEKAARAILIAFAKRMHGRGAIVDEMRRLRPDRCASDAWQNRAWHAFESSILAARRAAAVLGSTLTSYADEHVIRSISKGRSS